MDKETYNALAKARIERAAELVEEAQDLLANDRYKSAKPCLNATARKQ